MSKRFLASSGLCLAAAWSLLATPAWSDDPECKEALTGALYSPDVLSEDAPTYPVYRAWLCSRSYTSHAEAIADGLPEGVRVFGIPLERRGPFPGAVVADWREVNCPPLLRAVDIQRAEQAFLGLANTDQLEERRECQEEQELVCNAEVEGEFAIFRASYVEFRRTTGLRELRVDGELTEEPPFSPGQRLDAQGFTFARELEPGTRTISFALETDSGDCEATARVPRTRRLNRAPASQGGGRRRAN